MAALDDDVPGMLIDRLILDSPSAADASAGKVTGGKAARDPSKDERKVYVGALPFSWDKRAVREHFYPTCGELEYIHIPLDHKERSRGIAFISFYTQEGVEAALRMNGTYVKDRIIKVNMAGQKPVPGQTQIETKPAEEPESKPQEKPAKKKVKDSKDRKVFIGGVPFSCKAETLKKDFSECGAIQAFAMPTREDGSSRGIAFVTFSSNDGVAEALKFHDTDYGGCMLTVRMASDTVLKGAKGLPREGEADREQHRTGEANPLEVIVKGLPFGATEDVLREGLSKCGTIDSVRMPLNKKGKPKGFAFVTFENAKGVKKALRLSGSTIAGRSCKVEKIGEAKPNEAVPPDSKKRSAEEAEAPGAPEAPEVQQPHKVKKAKRAKITEASEA